MATNVVTGGATISDKFGLSINREDAIQMYNIGTFTDLSILNSWHHFKITGNEVGLYGYFDGSLLGNSNNNPISFNFSTFTLGDVNNNSGMNTHFYDSIQMRTIKEIYLMKYGRWYRKTKFKNFKKLERVEYYIRKIRTLERGGGIPT